MNDITLKPKVFIGSSREGMDIAEAIHVNLSRTAECTVWKDAFLLSGHNLGELMNSLRRSDFGIFVFSPDDLTTMRDSVSKTVRDNVLFELGLFIGRLGPERSFFLIPDNAADLRLPSDLAGITPGYYEGNRRDGNWIAALSPVCTLLKQRMAALRTFQDHYSAPAPAPAPKSEGASKGKNSVKYEKASEHGDGVSARYYKKSILVTGTLPSEKGKMEGTAGSWNRTLNGWVVPRSKEAQLRETFPGLEISAAE